MRFVYIPTNVPEWIHLFNDVAHLNGYPDARDVFDVRNDLKYCIDSLIRLYQTVDVLNEYKVTMKLQVKTKTKTTTQEFFDGYELNLTDFADSFLNPLQEGMNEFDILPQTQVMALRYMLKSAMEEMLMAIPLLIGKELHLTTEEENDIKYQSSP